MPRSYHIRRKRTNAQGMQETECHTCDGKYFTADHFYTSGECRIAAAARSRRRYVGSAKMGATPRKKRARRFGADGTVREIACRHCGGDFFTLDHFDSELRCKEMIGVRHRARYAKRKLARDKALEVLRAMAKTTETGKESETTTS